MGRCSSSADLQMAFLANMDIQQIQHIQCNMKSFIVPLSRGGGGGDSHMKGARMLVFSLRGVNFGFWSHLGCSG